ncbi:MAG TPA: GtrA family protein [Devosiaceae bacterium]
MQATHKAQRHPLLRRLGGFLLAGGTGFVLDASILLALTRHVGLDPFSARLAAITCAALWTWQINRHVSFGRAHDGAAREGLRYLLVVVSAATINYAVYAMVLLGIPGTSPLIALVAATAISMGVSFTGFDRFVFRKKEKAAKEPPSMPPRKGA